MNERRIVITGMGALCPVGKEVPEIWEALLAGRSGIRPITLADTSDYETHIAGEVKDFDPRQYIDRSHLKFFDRFALMGIAASVEASRSAGFEELPYDSGRVGTILGVGIGGFPSMEKNVRALMTKGYRRVTPFFIPRMILNAGSGGVSLAKGLHGVNYAVSSACASGTHAIGDAFMTIKCGMQDAIFAGGSEAPLTEIGCAGFNRMGALSTRNDEPEKASRPFDRDRDGFVAAEGGAVLVMEELEAAKNRGANILAEIVGYGFSSDAHHAAIPCPDGNGAARAMSMALQTAKLQPEDIAYINAHGTSTIPNDVIETRAIKRVFGKHAEQGLAISSTKSMTGHLFGAAGALEAIVLACALRDQKVPPTINLDNPAPECDLDYVPHVSRELSFEYGMSNSFGFGGANACLIFRRY